MSDKLVEFNILDGGKGDLEIRLTDSGREMLEEVLPALQAGTYNGTWFSAFGDLIEWQLSNGWRWLSAEDVGALTDDTGSTILSDDVEDDDQGRITRVGRLWWYPQYEVHDQLSDLLRYGEIGLQRAVADDKPGDETSESTR